MTKKIKVPTPAEMAASKQRVVQATKRFLKGELKGTAKGAARGKFAQKGLREALSKYGVTGNPTYLHKATKINKLISRFLGPASVALILATDLAKPAAGDTVRDWADRKGPSRSQGVVNQGRVGRSNGRKFTVK